MADKALTCLAVRARTLEWSVLNKGGDKKASPLVQQAEIDPGEGRRTLLAGLQADRDRLVAEIRAKCGRLPAPVTLGIPASWVLLRVAELPAGSPDELAGMAELQIDKFSPFPIEESSLSYELLAEQEGRCRVLLSAIRTDSMDLLGGAFREAGIVPKWVDINLLGWWQLLKQAGKVHANGSQLFLIMDDGIYDLIIATGGIPVAFRSLSGLEELPAAEAEEEVTRELLYTLAALDLDKAGSFLGEVSIWHGGEAPAGLATQLASALGATPLHLNELASLPPLATGLRLRAEQRQAGTMDLAPIAWEEAETARRTKQHMILFSGLVAGLWLAAMAILFGGLAFQNHRIGSLESELGELKDPSEKVRAIRDRTQELDKYLDRSRSALECLREICARMPPGIELRQFNYHKNKNLELAGEAEGYSLVTDFKKGLEQSDLFVTTELSRTQHGAGGRENFKILCTLPGGEKP